MANLRIKNTSASTIRIVYKSGQTDGGVRTDLLANQPTLIFNPKSVTEVSKQVWKAADGGLKTHYLKKGWLEVVGADGKKLSSDKKEVKAPVKTENSDKK